jgi:hypothetical protein
LTFVATLFVIQSKAKSGSSLSLLWTIIYIQTHTYKKHPRCCMCTTRHNLF